MKKIMYVVSTLKSSGPTTQLYYLIKYLDRSIFSPLIVTLSDEPIDSSWNDFDALGVKITSLKLSRIRGLFLAKHRLKVLISNFNPDIIHSQGFRPNNIMMIANNLIPWVMTSHNYPKEDYPMKYKKFLGNWMASKQFLSMKKCRNVIACSKTIANKLSVHGINSIPIQNGIEIQKTYNKVNDNKFSHPIFICVGNLIARKNISFVIKAFNQFSKTHTGSLIILGDGVEMNNLKALITNEHVFFEGKVDNVNDYLAISDYFVSSSLSEGLPYTVLEALALGLPVFLSDIPSHQEIALEVKIACHIFKLSNGEDGLCNKFSNARNIFPELVDQEAISTVSTFFSAKVMSQKYQDVYSTL
jgi:glycosyltransferase involved in cell wall biosynthesis